MNDIKPNETYAEWIFRTHRPDNGHTLAEYREFTGLDRHPKPVKPDFTCQFESSLVLFHPETDAACDHLDGITTCNNYHLRFGTGFAVESRYAEDFAEQLVDDGFTVETPAGNLMGADV